MIQIVTYIIDVFICFFAVSNILLPIFYVLPKFIYYKIKGLAKSLPILGTFGPAAFWLFIVYLSYRISGMILGVEKNVFFYSVYTALVFSLFSYKAQRQVIRDEMYDTYKKHLSDKGRKIFLGEYDKK